MKVISWNVNGLRSVHKKGALAECIGLYNPDVFCLQETKSSADQVSFLEDEYPQYTQYYVSAEKKGYSGVSLWVKKDLGYTLTFSQGMEEFYADTEGRIARCDFGNIVICSVYFPNGGKSDHAWEQKLIFYQQFLCFIQDLESKGKRVIFCGDINCCHQEMDIARPKENDGKIGFHPKERNILTEWINAGWKDVWREKNPEVLGQYSWWTYRGGARDRNVGWRIDYFFAPEDMLSQVQSIRYINDQLGSDHCPVELVLEQKIG